MIEPRPKSANPATGAGRPEPTRFNSISSALEMAAFPTTGAIATTTVRKWLFCAPDARIESAFASLQFLPRPAINRAVRGRWWVFLCELTDAGIYQPVTAKVQVTDPKGEPFRLGSPISRLTVGRMVFCQIDFEAASALSSEPVFWSGADRLNVTVNLV